MRLFLQYPLEGIANVPEGSEINRASIRPFSSHRFLVVPDLKCISIYYYNGPRMISKSSVQEIFIETHCISDVDIFPSFVNVLVLFHIIMNPPNDTILIMFQIRVPLCHFKNLRIKGGVEEILGFGNLIYSEGFLVKDGFVLIVPRFFA